MKKVFITFMSLSLAFLIFIGIKKHNVHTSESQKKDLSQHVFDEILEIDPDPNYISYTDFRNEILLPVVNNQDPAHYISLDVNDRIIRIDSAQELYMFSVDASYNRDKVETMKFSSDVIAEILKQHYVLGTDIDYSVMGAQQFMPIGYNFVSLDNTPHFNIFTGIFDGRGFEIRNLYVSDYDYLITTETVGETVEDIAISPFYSMFTQNQGVIKNVGLVNPTFELRTVHTSISKAANLVGQNLGTVENVYVIDNRDDVFAGGIRMRTPVGSGISNYEAAGIVYENAATGLFRNAYYVGKNVVNAAYINNFKVQPVLFNNTGTIDSNKLIYDSTRYLETIQIGGSEFEITEPNIFANGEEESVLKSNSALGSSWYYYPNDRYPSLLGLDYVNGNYQITDAIDFITFSKIINYISPAEDNKNYNESSYVLTSDINFTQVAKGAYVIPEVEFAGNLSGLNGEGKNYYIANLEIIDGLNIEDYYYAGIFSNLSGSVNNITLSNFTLTLTNTDDYYSSIFAIGSIAGKLNGGIIEKVSVDVTLDLGTSSIGETAVGGIVGEASGNIMEVYVTGEINNNIKEFDPDHDIDPRYYIGGIVGKTGEAKLFLYNGLNQATINGIGTNTEYTTSENQVNIYTGGVVGYVENTVEGKHNLGFITNEGIININDFDDSYVTRVNQYVAGVVGYSTGLNYDFDTNTGYWTNTLDSESKEDDANIIINANSNYVYSSGIVVSNHSEILVFIYLYNYTGFKTNSFVNFKYANLVYDLGEGVILVQSENHANFTIDGNSEDYVGNNFNYSGVFVNELNKYSRMEFVSNYGDITYKNLTFSSERSIAGISLSENIDYLNAYFSGNIYVLNTTSSFPIWISGITKVLSPNRYMKNSMTRGKLINDEFEATNIVVAGHATGSSQTAHIYVGGLVNINKAGDLHTQDNSSFPKATTGILNSINYANITTTYESLYGVTGRGNFFAGGIVTLNGGSIQDTANMGDLKISNLTNNAQPDVAFYTGGSTSQYAGRVQTYRGSVILGGVTSAVIVGESRIYDSTNSGDVFAITTNLARAGGILGLSLFEELEAGNVPLAIILNGYTDNSTNRNRIEISILSNGLNYGDISALTKNRGEYNPGSLGTSEQIKIYTSSTPPLSNTATRRSLLGNIQGTEERIGIYASAGGVIGYGLCEMKRMINHGRVSSTDVAGGIVGATYTGIRSTTVVFIDTAINYGFVRMIDNTNFGDMAGNTNITYDDLELYDPNDPLIKQHNHTNQNLRPSEYPRAKRGIGGIFGRLQRVYATKMSSVNGKFDFIVNMDPDVDLIGRLDQVNNFSLSSEYYEFREVKFYTANPNDLTQAVFAGYRYFYGNNANFALQHTRTYQAVTKERYRYQQIGNVIYEYHEEFIESWTEITITGTLHEIKGGRRTVYNNHEELISYTVNPSSSWSTISETVVDELKEDRIIHLDFNKGNPITSNTVNAETHRNNNNNPRFYIVGANKVPRITENPDDVPPSQRSTQFIYDENFEMRTDPELSQYIYYVENALLSDRFKSARPYGMYVLSTSSGSAVGSTLPANVDLTKLYPLADQIEYGEDYDFAARSELENEILAEYESLLQVQYNDKSELLQENNIKLEEISGAKTLLLNPTINYQDKIITFNLNYKLVKGLSSVSYRIIDADLPVNAQIGPELNTNPDINAPPELILNNPGSQYGIINIGYFTSYSEAAREVSIFRTEDYTSTYLVRINLQQEPVQESPNIYRYRRDNGGTLYTTPGSVNHTLEVIFRDPQSVLNNGSEISGFVSLWFGDDEVLEEYYVLTSTGVSGINREFTIKLALSSQLRSGTYTIRYRYFELDNNSIDREITFTKNTSTVNDILDLSHYSSGDVTITTNQIYSEINFGYPLNTNITFSSTEIEDIPSYLNNFTYSISILSELEIAPFAAITEVRYINQIHEDGYITYVFEYDITSESNATKTYTHYISERTIEIENYYKNNNKVSGSNLFATREALTTRFSFDFGIDKVYSNLIYNLESENPTMYFEVSSLIPGVVASTESYLNLDMDQTVVPGFYTFPIKYVRTNLTVGHQEIDLGTVTIEKRQGVNAHLMDIKFSETIQDTDYPEIYVSDSNGVIDTSKYLPRVYFAGIDYNGSHLDNTVTDYRINGKISNIPLNEYTPLFLDYLPPGAKIARKLYNQAEEWTTPVDKNSDPSLIAQLAADFTRYPDTGEEPGEEDDDVLITYKVISENGEKEVFYHISVVDVTFNVSLIFNVVIESSASELGSTPVLINVRNINVKENGIGVDFGTTPINDPNLFPSFDEVSGINNSINMYYLETTGNYKYRFGRNMSGFFSFHVLLPRLNNGFEYTYEIYYEFSSQDNYLLNDVGEYDASEVGKYYYIHGGTRNRTREFTIVIKKQMGNPLDYYGLYDSYYSWQ